MTQKVSEHLSRFLSPKSSSLNFQKSRLGECLRAYFLDFSYEEEENFARLCYVTSGHPVFTLSDFHSAMMHAILLKCLAMLFIINTHACDKYEKLR